MESTATGGQRETVGAGTPPVGTLRYWAAAKAAAGTAEEPYRAATLAEALAEARRARPDDHRFAEVLRRSSFLVDGDPVGARDHHEVRLREGGTVEVLPPFAGG
ncbi:MoaD/ThiS family protein [Allostreptomyces psammosilenae]|uniref:Molybdopterin converting factor small subunit n=1 Tax=Allostreptomyces psammosilenae TaxID=1892865 RepID=A0A852ZZI5_9ACTN|nr:MoaD/ThiS family protein [Allostreptomyces psammosilenae]NYI07515.1 molybdopterin converting factor small subunit [Allostreptomyces psammosilenae]